MKKESTINYTVNNKKYKLLVADSPEKWKKGLMYIRKLDNVDGMIFIFPDKQIRTFWNKNTYFGLDVYWIDKDKVVGKDYLPSIEKSKEIATVQSGVEVNRVVEIIR